MKQIISLFSISILLVACGGGSKLSLKEAEQVTLHYQGENYTPPPRGVDKLIDEIKFAGDGLVENQICRMCAAMDPDDPNRIFKESLWLIKTS